MSPSEDKSEPTASDRAERRFSRLRNAVLFVAVLDLWIILDQVTKYLLRDYRIGDVVAGPFGGIFQIGIVHNTGGAWGLFGDSPIPLAIVSIVVCIVLILYLFVYAPTSSPIVAIGIALICAGGIGNTIDRLHYGYVLDFIDPTFIDFPVFNIADIGVTVGVLLLFLGYFLRISREATRIRQERAAEERRQRNFQLERESRDRQAILDDDSDDEEIAAMAEATRANIERQRAERAAAAVEEEAPLKAKSAAPSPHTEAPEPPAPAPNGKASQASEPQSAPPSDE